MDLKGYDFGTLTNYGTGWYSPELAAVKPAGIADTRRLLESMTHEEFNAAIASAISAQPKTQGYAKLYAEQPDYAWQQFQTNAGKDQVAGNVWKWSPQGNWWQKTAGLGPAPDASEGFLDSVFVPIVKMAIGAALAVTAGAAFSGELFATGATAGEAGGMSVIPETVGQTSTFSTEILNLPYGGATIDPAFTGQVFYTGGALPVSITGAAGMSIAPAVFEASGFSLLNAAKEVKQLVSETRNAQTIGNIISPPQTAPIKPRSIIIMETTATPAPAFSDRNQENAQQAAAPSNIGGMAPHTAIAGQPENYKAVALMGAALVALYLIFGGKS